MASFTKTFRKTFLQLLERRFKIVVTVTVIPILGIGYLLFLQPIISRITKVGAFTLQRTEEQLSLKRTILDATTSLVDKYDQLELGNLSKLRGVLPTEKDLPGLFVQSEALASASGLHLASVSFTEVASTVATRRTTTNAEGNVVEEAAATSADSIQKITVNMHVTGGRGYEHLKQFLTNLESEIRLLEVQSVTYAPAAEGEEQYTINAITYYVQ